MKSINNKYTTIGSSIVFFILVLIITFTGAMDNDQARLLVISASAVDILVLVSSIIRLYKHGEITTFKSDDDF